MRNAHLGAIMALILPIIAACGTMPQTSSGPETGRQSAASTTPRTLKVGVLAVVQSPAVDRMVDGRNADQYYELVRQALDSSRTGFVGANGPVTMTLRSGDNIFWTQDVTVTGGYARTEIPIGTRFPRDAALCVETPQPIAHQRHRPEAARPGQHMMCAQVYRFFAIDQRTGIFFLTFIRSAG